MATSSGTNEPIDQQEKRRFAKKAFGDLVGFMNVSMCMIGERLGLFQDLAANGPATSSELAKRTGIVERYAREWLAQMACAEYLKYGPVDQRFRLPPEYMASLTEEGGIGFLGGVYQNLQSIEAGLIGKLQRAFREGGGIPYEDYNEDYWDGLDRATMSTFKHMLVEKYIPAMPTILESLENGCVVAEVGCGRGGIIRTLAGRFPRSRFVGYDSFAPNVTKAQADAVSAGCLDRVRYAYQDPAEKLPERYDLIFSIDSLHHVADVPGFMCSMREALNPGGSYIVIEEACAESLEENIGPAGAMLFAGSVFVCVPQALSESDQAYGVAGLTAPIMRDLSSTAGFHSCHLVPLENAGSNVYEMRA